MPVIRLLSAGATRSVVTLLETRLAPQGVSLAASFGPAGKIRDLCRQGEPFDVVILTAELLAELATEGTVDGGSVAEVGRGRTGAAVRRGADLPYIGHREALRAVLLAADAIHCPDTRIATSGIHFAEVLNELGIADEVRGRITESPSGAAAMSRLAMSSGRTIGFTQMTEILDAPGVELVGSLPPEFEQVTVYAAAVGASATEPDVASQFVEVLTGPGSLELRAAAGFDVDAAT